MEPSGVSHPAKVIDILRSPNFSSVIDLRNVICLVDPGVFEDSRWRETQVFYDQIQLADIVVLNWADKRAPNLIQRCRDWVEAFRPAKQLVVEASFGEIDSELLDMDFNTIRFPLFVDAHPTTDSTLSELTLVSPPSQADSEGEPAERAASETASLKAMPRKPLRFQNDDANYDACGWIFHVNDVFNRDKLLDFLGYVHPIVRLKGIFRCEGDWWMINRAKDGTSYARSAYRRDSRLEIILDKKTSGWDEIEVKLLECLADLPSPNANPTPSS